MSWPQSLDYAGWVERLRAEDIAAIYGRSPRGAVCRKTSANRSGTISTRRR